MRTVQKQFSLLRFSDRGLFLCPRCASPVNAGYRHSSGKLLVTACFFFPPLQAPADSAVSEQGLAEGGNQENSASLCQEVTKLTTALQEYQDIVQVRLLMASVRFHPPPTVRMQCLVCKLNC